MSAPRGVFWGQGIQDVLISLNFTRAAPTGSARPGKASSTILVPQVPQNLILGTATLHNEGNAAVNLAVKLLRRKKQKKRETGR